MVRLYWGEEWFAMSKVATMANAERRLIRKENRAFYAFLSQGVDSASARLAFWVEVDKYKYMVPGTRVVTIQICPGSMRAYYATLGFAWPHVKPASWESGDRPNKSTVYSFLHLPEEPERDADMAAGVGTGFAMARELAEALRAQGAGLDRRTCRRTPFIWGLRPTYPQGTG